jgi:hypothetical protein
MIASNKNLLYYVLLLVLSNTVTAVSVSSGPHEIKYVDPSNAKNYVIFVPDTQNQNKGNFDLVQEKGDCFSGTYTKTSETYSLDFPHGNRFVIKGDKIKIAGKYWNKI